MLLKVLQQFETEAAGLGIIAEGKFPMFEHGTLCLFHNDQCVHGKVCHMEKYGSVPEWRARSQNPANLIFGNQLDEVADLMAVLVKKPNALVGGDPTRYGCVGEDLE